MPLVTPLFGANVLTDHPTLTWPAVDKVEAYHVELRGGDGKRVLEPKETDAEFQYRTVA